MKKGLIKKDSKLEIKLNAEEAENFIIACYGIFKLKQEEEINLPTKVVDSIGVVYDKVVEFINEHDLGKIEKGILYH